VYAASATVQSKWLTDPREDTANKGDKTIEVHSDVLCPTVNYWLELGGQGYLHPLSNNQMLTILSETRINVREQLQSNDF
jgi:hypothetical protein